MPAAASSVTLMELTCGDDTEAIWAGMRVALYSTAAEKERVSSVRTRSFMNCLGRSLIAAIMNLFFKAGQPLVVTLEMRLVRPRPFCYTFIANAGERNRSDRRVAGL